MSNSELHQQLNYTTALRQNRMRAALWVLDHPETVEALLKYCFEDETELSYKAAWVLEFVCLEKLELLFPYLDHFFRQLPEVKRDQTLRAMAHICEILCIQYYKKQHPELKATLTQNHKTVMIDCSFDWLITDQKVACQVRAMTCLYFLGTEFDWIHTELKEIILLNLPSGSAGYKSRGTHTLESIGKFSNS